MAIRATTALVNKLAQGFGIRDLLKDMTIYVYTGGQPASGDDVPSGNNLLIFTDGGVVFVGPTSSMAALTMAGTGTLDTLKVGGMDFNLLAAPVAISAGDLPGSAALVAASINSQDNPLNVVATVVGNDVKLWLPEWMGAEGDSLSAAITQTTATCSIDAAFAAGVTAIGGMNFDFPAVDGKISMPVGADWKGTGVVAGTAGWFRAVAGGSDVNALGADEIRFDGVLQSSGGDLDMGSLTIVVGGVQTVASISITQPKART